MFQPIRIKHISGYDLSCAQIIDAFLTAAVASSYLNPNATNGRFVGITFNNVDHSTVGIPHASGSKWCAQTGGALVCAQCTGCHYSGDFEVE